VVSNVIVGLETFMGARTDPNPVSEDEYIGEWRRLIAQFAE
jgi:hypothetical protein